MTKEEAKEILTNEEHQCPLCKQMAARLLMRYPQGVSSKLLDIADKIRWQYTGKEKHL